MEHFWSKVSKDSDGCWRWTAYCDRDGYGLFVVSRGVTRRAHRVAFEMEHGSLPKGVPLDHLCHDPLVCDDGPRCAHRRCVRPSHLTLSNSKANASRTAKGLATHCKHGHLLDAANTYIKPNGTRACRACHGDREKSPEAKVRRAAAARRYRKRQKE